MKKSIKHKPLTNNEYKVLYGKHPLTDLFLNTGARLMEVKRIIDTWDGGSNHVDIKTKKSGEKTNRVYLNEIAQTNLKQLNEFKDKSLSTIKRKVSDILNTAFMDALDVSSHNLRATFITRALQFGVSLVTVQHLVNHSDISITAQYCQFNENHLLNTLEYLSDLKTVEGKSMDELYQEVIKLREHVRRLEKGPKKR